MPALLISSSLSRSGERGQWIEFQQHRPYIQGIITGDIDTQEVDSITLNNMISGIPTPWARAKMYGYAIKYSGGNDSSLEKSGLLRFYTSLINEWKGLLACLALFPAGIKVEPMSLSVDGNQAKDFYRLPNMLRGMLLDEDDLWVDTNSHDQQDGHTRRTIQLIYYKDILVGATSPYSIVFPAASYDLRSHTGNIKWYRQGKFHDPLKYGNLSADQKQKLFLLLSNISDNIEKFDEELNAVRQRLNDGDSRVRPHDLQPVAAFLNSYKDQVRTEVHAEAGGTLDSQLIFQPPYAQLFTIKSTLFWNGAHFLRNADEQGLEEVDPTSLLLNSDSLVQILPANEEHALQHSAIHLLEALDPQTNEKAYFSLPLSAKALTLFQNQVGELLRARKNYHRMTASIQPRTYKVQVQIELFVGGRHVTPITRHYDIEPIEAGRNVIVWPDFVSKYWKYYYLYSELPSNDTVVRLIPFLKDWDNDELFFKSDGKGNLFFANDTIRFGDISVTKLVKFPLDGRIHKYEIYRLNKPLAGLEIRQQRDGKESVSGYLVLKDSRDFPGMNLLGDLSRNNPHEAAAESVVVGIDFGSNNSCITYADKKGLQAATFKNRRVFLLGVEVPNNNDRFAAPHELLFFQNEEIGEKKRGQFKSWVHTHNRLSVLGHDEEVGAGVPIFEPNIQVRHMDDYVMQTNVGDLYHNLKWQSDVANMNLKKGFLKTLWIKLLAELYADGKIPQGLRWSHPGSFSTSDRLSLRDIYAEVASVGFRNIPFDDSMTEAAAVCNYALTRGGFSILPESLMLGIDIGGSTSDILLVGRTPDERRAQLMAQSSVRLAANKLTESIKLSGPVRDAIHAYITSNKAPFTVLGIDNMKQDPDTAPYYVNTILDQLADDHFNAFYRAIATPLHSGVSLTESRKIFAIPAYICGLLLFYSGRLASKVVSEKGLPGVKTVHLYPFGKGGRLFDWLDSRIGKSDAMAYYQNCFDAGWDDDDAIISLKKEDAVRHDNKSEVSYGLSAACTGEEVIVIGENVCSDIFGEDGFVVNGGSISARDEVTHDQMQHIISPDHLPERFVRFESFLSNFLELVGPNGMNIVTSRSQIEDMLPELRLRIPNYINTDPEFRKAQVRSRTSSRDNTFDYRHSVLMLIGMCFIDEVLMPLLLKNERP